MIGVRRAMADGWAPSVSVLLHASVLMAAIFLVGRSTLPLSGEKPIPVSLVTIATPPPARMPESIVAPEPEPVPLTSAAETAPVAPPLKKVIPKTRRDRPPQPPAQEPVAAVDVPSNVATAPSDAPVRSTEPAGPPPSYLASLRQKLERNKIYPRAARQRREEGTALLRFVVDRDGHVVSRRVEKSTGYGELDREVEAMLERAQPLPAMPAEMTQAQLELLVPVDFHLR